ncbi:unnamed protein product [Paramecium octaurelia]|uniref:Endonuclease/exonuclease/phosphatase domain-containing protein n=1 Tax=Paramecium octaurelia TaxID=43137 RepID=A0A8S1SQW9_PAROT|nr:unnamed protein product [Paramecium octaurelia]
MFEGGGQYRIFQEYIKNLQYDICYFLRPQRSNECLIAFKIEKYKILKSLECSFDQLALDYGLPPLNLRMNVFQIVRFQKKIIQNRKHSQILEFKKKTTQVVKLVQFMEAQKEFDDQIIIFCGDLNSLPKLNPIQYIQKNYPIVEEQKCLQIKYSFKMIYFNIMVLLNQIGKVHIIHFLSLLIILKILMAVLITSSIIMQNKKRFQIFQMKAYYKKKQLYLFCLFLFSLLILMVIQFSILNILYNQLSQRQQQFITYALMMLISHFQHHI